MYANNRSGSAPPSRFRTAGGNVYTFAHPFLTGQLSAGATPGNPVVSSLNEVDISRCLKLNDTFFNASPTQDNAFQEVLVDGSVITVTNHLMAGRATIQVVPTTGLVRDGDLTAIAPFIVSSKDDVGGVLTRKRFVNGVALTRIYYGTSFTNFPHDIDAGNAVPTYTIIIAYAGWVEGIMKGVASDKMLWAVGNAYGLQGNFVPFEINGAGMNGTDTAGLNQFDEGYFDINDAAIGSEHVTPVGETIRTPIPAGFDTGNRP